MTTVHSQLDAGVRQIMGQFAETAVYTRKDTAQSVSVSARITEPDYRIANDESLVMLAANRWDAIVMTTDLAFGGAVYEPQPGDTIAAGSTVYTVTVDESRRYCWTWIDEHRIRRRIFLKETATA